MRKAWPAMAAFLHFNAANRLAATPNRGSHQPSSTLVKTGGSVSGLAAAVMASSSRSKAWQSSGMIPRPPDAEAVDTSCRV